jgi:peptidoglycan/xylan/chitin deacetylase (PgdA/CDA1 family)
VVTPEQEGRSLDISATAARIRGASSGQEVTPEWIAVYPRVRVAMFSEIRLGVLSKSQVSLMFNVAWGEEFLPGILDVLNKAGVRATFFVDGHWGRMFPALVRRLAAEGHDVATHGAEHVDPTKLAPAEIRALIEDGTAVLKAAGVRPKRIFAPPAGACSPTVCRVAAELGYWTVLWTADTVDWQRPAPEVIADRVFRKVKKGALVLMHPTSPTLTALPGIINGLHQMGYQLVPVSAQLPPTLE